MEIYNMRTACGIFLIICVMWSGPNAGASDDGASDEFAGLEEHMTPDEMDATGVSRLTTDERETLDAWIADYIAGARESSQASVADTDMAQKQKPADKEPDEIVARVVSGFNGWTGDTVFELDNGQVWKQRTSGRYIYSGEDPKVVIKKNFFGFHELHHVASARSVGVKRVE